MPTEELKKLLDREAARVNVQPLTELTTPLLRELVNAGLSVFDRSHQAVATKNRENEDVAALILLRQIVEMADGVQELVALSCGTAAIPVLRSQFEASVGLSYLLSEDDRYIQRSLSWLVGNLHSGISRRNTLEPGTAKGAEYKRTYEMEFGRILSGSPNSTIAAEIATIENHLRSPQFAPVEAEYQAMKRKKSNRVPQWYSLFDGPNNFADLSAKTGSGAMYQLLYGDWSGLGHANDLRRFVSSENGQPAFDGVRRPTELKEISLYSSVLLAGAIRRMSKRFCPGEDLVPWYEQEVKPLLDRLRNMEITFTSVIAQ